MRKLRGEGWLCSRSAASHGPVDVFAAKEGNILMIQVKSGRGRLKPGDRDVLKRWAQAYGGTAEVWYFRKKRGIVREIIFEGAGSQRPIHT